jgi:pyruvate-formate lyase-activating enzyme
MPDLIAWIKERFTPVTALPPGSYHLEAAPDKGKPYRMYLRLDADGSGILVVNAATVLQLNPTAAEYAYHFVRGAAPEDAAKIIASRYRINREHARADFRDFVDRIHTLVETEDLDPVTFLDFERIAPNSAALSAPLRLDCALTYQLPEGADPLMSPAKRVTRELTTDEWKAVLDKAWDFGIPHIVFTGGEATLRDDLPELIERAEHNGQVCGLLTDGHKLNDRAYLHTLLQTGLDHLTIVLPTVGEPNWQAIQTVSDADIFFTIHITLTPQNVTGAEALLEKLEKIDASAISLSSADPSLNNDLARLGELVADLGMRLVSDLPVPYSQANPVAQEVAQDEEISGAGRAWLYVEPDGDVLPAQGDKILGNVLSDDWEKIYHS